MRGKDLEFLPILGDRATRNGNTAGEQRLHDFLVGKRFIRLLVAYQFNDGLFDGVLGDDLTGGGANARRKEVFELKNSVRGSHVFVGNGPTDGGFMDAHHFGHFGHRERLEKAGALLKKANLNAHDFLGDFHDGILPLMNATNEKLAGADALANVTFNILTLVRLAENVFIDIADPKVRQPVVIDQDDPFVIHFLNDQVGSDVLAFVRNKTPARIGIERADEGCGPVRLFQADASRLRRDTGWRPRVTLAESLRETLASWRRTTAA